MIPTCQAEWALHGSWCQVDKTWTWTSVGCSMWTGLRVLNIAVRFVKLHQVLTINTGEKYPGASGQGRENHIEILEHSCLLSKVCPQDTILIEHNLPRGSEVPNSSPVQPYLPPQRRGTEGRGGSLSEAQDCQDWDLPTGVASVSPPKPPPHHQGTIYSSPFYPVLHVHLSTKSYKAHEKAEQFQDWASITS